jgi:hypothetical protein
VSTAPNRAAVKARQTGKKRLRLQILTFFKMESCLLFSETPQEISVSDNDLDILGNAGGVRTIQILEALNVDQRRFFNFADLIAAVRLEAEAYKSKQSQSLEDDPPSAGEPLTFQALPVVMYSLGAGKDQAQLYTRSPTLPTRVAALTVELNWKDKGYSMETGSQSNSIMTLSLVRAGVVVASVNRFGVPGFNWSFVKEKFPDAPENKSSIQPVSNGMNINEVNWVQIVELAEAGDHYEFWCQIGPSSELSIKDFLVTVTSAGSPDRGLSDLSLPPISHTSSDLRVTPTKISSGPGVYRPVSPGLPRAARDNLAVKGPITIASADKKSSLIEVIIISRAQILRHL